MMKRKKLPHAAGVYEQDDDEPTGWRKVVFSRHRTREAADKAAAKYKRELQKHGPQTGGSMTWESWSE